MRPLSLGRFGFRRRQREVERGAFADPALRPDPSAVAMDHTPGNRESRPEPFEVAPQDVGALLPSKREHPHARRGREQGVGVREHEDPAELFRGDPRWAALPAVRSGRVLGLPTALALSTSHHAVRTVEVISDWLHPAEVTP